MFAYKIMKAISLAMTICALSNAFASPVAVGESVGNTYPKEVSLRIPEGTFSGYSVYTRNRLICDSFDKLDSGHKFNVIKLTGNNLNFNWGSKISFSPHFSVPVRLVEKPASFALSKGRLSVVVGYLTVNGVDEEIELALRK